MPSGFGGRNSLRPVSRTKLSESSSGSSRTGCASTSPARLPSSAVPATASEVAPVAAGLIGAAGSAGFEGFGDAGAAGAGVDVTGNAGAALAEGSTGAGIARAGAAKARGRANAAVSEAAAIGRISGRGSFTTRRGRAAKG